MEIRGNRKLSSRLWLSRRVRDIYVKRARREGYRSRAAFKLMELDDKFHLIKNAKRMVDLGAAPGGWSQVLALRSSQDARIAAIDLLPFNSLNRVQQFLGNFENENNQLDIMNYLGQKADLIVSDMAPSTVGHAQSDHIQIMRLAENVRAFALTFLVNRGAFVVKIFQGGKEKLFLESLKENFLEVCFFKPKSSRSLSAEMYIVAMEFMG